MGTVSPTHIDAVLSVAPQLQAEDMRAVAAAGFRSVVNNRPDFESGAHQPTSAQLEAAARAAGLQYHHLPAPPANHTEAQARDMTDAVNALPHPVLAFCGTGRRATALYHLGKSAA